MCGICGIFGHNDGSYELAITRMGRSLVHRGPDGSGTHVDELCALGHRRLAVIDLTEHAKQPMKNEDGTVWSIVNGEIYNYRELREELKRQGHVFVSECDSEVLPHLYEQHGTLGFINRLRGMFSLALYSSLTGTLVLARDPVGKKPLYYYRDRNRIVFASEIKALFEAGVPREVNYAAIPSWLLYQYTIGWETLFKGVYKLQAGSMMVCDSEGRSHEVCYWSPVAATRYDDTVDSPGLLRGALEESVKLRLRSDVPVGSFLSGGVDSSAVTALYRQFYDGDLHTFTAAFENKSESSYAKKVSQHLGTIYHEVPITAEMVFRDINKITWHYDEPLGDAAIICNYYLAREAKKHVTVVLAGEGGDELFGGYPWHSYANMLGRISRVPYWLRKPMAGFDNGDVTSRFYKERRMLSVLEQPNLAESLLYPTTAMGRDSVKWLLKQEIPSRNGHRDLRSGTYYDHMLGLDFLNLLPEKFLMKADKGTMSHAIEERLPLLDMKVVELAFQMSPRMKRQKWVMRQAVADLLPEDITWRPKQGFGTPYDRWICDRGPVRNLVIDRLATGKFLSSICNAGPLDKVVKHLVSGRNDSHGRMALGSTNVIWSLFTLQLWHDIWFGGG